jgi:Xaa-Pro aminopeptidase
MLRPERFYREAVMRAMTVPTLISLLPFVLMAPAAHGQAGRANFTEHFTREEFVSRRARVAQAIGPDGIAVLQGAPSTHSSGLFRQSNEFFYLTGVVVPQAYLMIDGGGWTTLYLPHSDPGRALTEGDLLTSDDPQTAATVTGVDDVVGLEMLSHDLNNRARAARKVYLAFRPAEGMSESRDGAQRRNADAAADPWDGRPSREAHFINLVRTRAPFLEIRDLSPILDDLRAIKSPAELALIDRATRMGGEAILEAMRSTEPGVQESELDAVAQFIFVRNGAQGEAYRAIVASGPTAWNAHHRAAPRAIPDGELVLMDFCPDVGFYRCDVTRMWPANGRFNAWQRELYGFYLGIYEAILHEIKPGITGQAVLQAAVEEMDRILARTRFSKPAYERAGRAFVEQYRRSAERPTAGLGHAVGMSTHDFGSGTGVLTPGLVFTIEPQFRVPEENIYIRLEDMVHITPTGADILSDWLPRDIDRIERIMAEAGLLQTYGPIRFATSPSAMPTSAPRN